MASEWNGKEFNKFLNLDKLTLYDNKLSVLSPKIGELRTLVNLNLADNQLTVLPPEIGELRRLVELYLPNNQLTVLPPEIGNLVNLTELSLSHNQLTVLPSEIGNLVNLTQLSLINNQLTVLPPEIRDLVNLTQLNLSQNKLTVLPPEIGNLVNLTELSLIDNRLTVLPSEIGNLVNLIEMNLNSNELTVLPPEIGNLIKLEFLVLANNKLTALPPEIGNLIKLEFLVLINNQLTALPQEITKLINLEELDLTENSLLTTIPPELELMPNLKIYRDKTKKTQDLQPLNQPTLNIFKNVLCNNYLEGEDNTIPDFLTETLDENPFIVEHKNIYSGNALGWLLKEFPDEKDPREFVECKDETPSEWQGNAYARYVKPDGRTFVNVRVNGSNILVLKPDWFWYGPIPETRLFHLEPQAPVKKYMTNHLLPNIRPDFNALGADHCNQTGEMIPYKLVEITENSAPAFVAAAKYKTDSSATALAVGGKRRKNKYTIKQKHYFQKNDHKHKKYKTLKHKHKLNKHKQTNSLKHKQHKRKQTKRKKYSL